MAALCGRLAELGYGWAFRVLDARHFGVPQRRRRVFIVGLRSGPDDADGRLAAERAAAVLAVGSRCPRHPATGHQTGSGVAEGVEVGTIQAGRHGYAPEPGEGIVHANPLDDARGQAGRWQGTALGGGREPDAGSLPDTDAVLVISSSPDARGVRAPDGLAGRLDDCGGVEEVMLPLGLDSHRYRCCGNGVVAPVAEWLGWRLREALA